MDTKPRQKAGKMFLNLELSHELVRSQHVFALQVFHEAATFRNHFDETRRRKNFVSLKMACKFF